ncbi:hypothetical protein BH23VER1_BH23VER1_27890 [soil metagenome]
MATDLKCRHCGACLLVAAFWLAGCLPENLTTGIGVDPDAPKAETGEAAGAEELPPLEAEPAFVPDPSVAPVTIDKTVQVSVLGYHDFSTKQSSNDMVINIGKFREQMQALHDSGIAVISMDDLLAWRKGEKEIPNPSVVITIDDGWKSTHELALPVLKEFGFPFTLFLYSRYVDGGGRALTTPAIKELIANGATIGSHSWSHPTPGRVRAASKEPPEKRDEFLLRELQESKKFLEDKFGVEVKTFAYPGGIFTERMIELNDSTVGYEALFTCNPAKVDWETPMSGLNRFIILANHDGNFRLGTTFPGRGGSALDANAFAAAPGDDEDERPVIVLTPENSSTIGDRRPLISADLSGVEGFDPKSLTLNVSGFGKVAPTFDEETKVLSYTPRQSLRTKDVTVTATFLREGKSKPEMLVWAFEVDPLAAYLGED